MKLFLNLILAVGATLSLVAPVFAGNIGGGGEVSPSVIIGGQTQAQAQGIPEDRGRMATSGTMLTRTYSNFVALHGARPGHIIGNLTTQAQFEVDTRGNLLWFGQRFMQVQRGIDHLPWWNPTVEVVGAVRPVHNMGRLAIQGVFMSAFERHPIHHVYFMWAHGWYEFQAF